MLQMAVEKLLSYSQENIGDILSSMEPILQHRKKLYERYARKTSSNTMMQGKKVDGKEKAIVAFEYYIVNMVQGYLGGKSPMYAVRKGEHEEGYAEEYKAAIDRIRRYNDDAATFIELIHDYLITTAAYLYVFEDVDNEIRYVRFDSLQTVAVFDYATPPKQIGCIRTWKQQDEEGKDQIAVEVITETARTLYVKKEGGYQEEDTESLAWQDVPAVAFENPDEIAVFEPALSSIDTYEQLVSNVRDMTQYNDEAKLMLVGYALNSEAGTKEREEEERRIAKAPVIYVGENGDVKWLLKEVNYDGILSIQSNLHDLITMLTGVPNLTDDAFSNADNASALGYKLYALDQYSATTDRVFRKGYLRLWEIITGRLNMKGNKFDFRDIDIIMQRNIPTDKDKSISRAATMKQSGLFSDETCINESQVEVNAQEEIHRRQQEAEEAYDRQVNQMAEEDIGD